MSLIYVHLFLPKNFQRLQNNVSSLARFPVYSALPFLRESSSTQNFTVFCRSRRKQDLTCSRNLGSSQKRGWRNNKFEKAPETFLISYSLFRMFLCSPWRGGNGHLVKSGLWVCNYDLETSFFLPKFKSPIGRFLDSHFWNIFGQNWRWQGRICFPIRVPNFGSSGFVTSWCVF
jgi:hypothetical protein